MAWLFVSEIRRGYKNEQLPR